MLGATLYEGRQMFIPFKLLAVRTQDTIYQFGFNPWCGIAPHLPFECERERIRLRYSPFSIVVRVVAVGYLLYWLWGRFA